MHQIYYTMHTFLTFLLPPLDERSGSLHTPTAIPPGEKIHYLLEWRLGRPNCHLGHGGQEMPAPSCPACNLVTKQTELCKNYSNI
jgi:hypothetical protein